MTTSERKKVMAQLARQFAWPGLSKPDVQAAVDALDDFLDSNATAINNAFPQPFRAAATTQQKALVVSLVAARRAGLLTTQEG